MTFATPNSRFPSSQRNPGRFSGGVEATYLAFLELTGIPIRDYFLKPEACAELYHQGRRRIRDLFGPDVSPGGCLSPYVAYGHLSALGARLEFPEGGEVSVAPLYDSLDEAIRMLGQEIDFSRAGMAPFYTDFHRRLQARFPGEPVGFGFSHNGPITSAYLLRGPDFFTDLYDDPPRVKEYLRRLTASIREFCAWKAAYLEQPSPPNPRGAHLSDDIAAMVPPAIWPEFVIPAWNWYYEALTTGTRSVHCENLSEAHLPHLGAVGVSSYDPFVSPRLDPAIIARACRVPFQWGLPSFRYAAMTEQDVRDFVFMAAAAGAEYVYSHVEGPMCRASEVPKALAFARACREVKFLVNAGEPRVKLARHVSRNGFWEWWRDRQ